MSRQDFIHQAIMSYFDNGISVLKISIQMWKTMLSIKKDQQITLGFTVKLFLISSLMLMLVLWAALFHKVENEIIHCINENLKSNS